MRIKNIIVGFVLIPTIILLAHEACNFTRAPDAHKLRWEYNGWKWFGGDSYNPKFYNELLRDSRRQRTIRGLSIEEVLKKYPHIINSEDLEYGSYKRKVYESGKRKYEQYELYWMNANDVEAGWCIEIKGTNAPSLRLMGLPPNLWVNK